MRITFISPPFDLSGGQRVIAIYAERLRRRGHDVVVVTPPPRQPRAREIVRSLLRGRGWPKLPERSPSHFDRIDVECRVIERYRPITDSDVPGADVIIATWWETAEWVAALSPAKGVKVHFMQDYEVWGGPRERVDAACRLPMPKIIIAGWVGKLLRDRFCDDDFTLIPNSVDTNMFHAPPRGKQCRPTVGMVYTTFFNKGCDISLRAYELARREVPDLKLVAFGGQPTSDLPLPDSCEFSYHCPQRSAQGHLLSLRRLALRNQDRGVRPAHPGGHGLPHAGRRHARRHAPELLTSGGGVLVRPEDPADIGAGHRDGRYAPRSRVGADVRSGVRYGDEVHVG